MLKTTLSLMVTVLTPAVGSARIHLVVAPPDVQVDQGTGGADGVEGTETKLTGVRPSPTRRAVLQTSQPAALSEGCRVSAVRQLNTPRTHAQGDGVRQATLLPQRSDGSASRSSAVI